MDSVVWFLDNLVIKHTWTWILAKPFRLGGIFLLDFIVLLVFGERKLRALNYISSTVHFSKFWEGRDQLIFSKTNFKLDKNLWLWSVLFFFFLSQVWPTWCHSALDRWPPKQISSHLCKVWGKFLKAFLRYCVHNNGLNRWTTWKRCLQHWLLLVWRHRNLLIITTYFSHYVKIWDNIIVRLFTHVYVLDLQHPVSCNALSTVRTSLWSLWNRAVAYCGVCTALGHWESRTGTPEPPPEDPERERQSNYIRTTLLSRTL